jgi:hypothetical protein
VDGFSVLLEPREPDRFLLGEPIVVGLDLHALRDGAVRAGEPCQTQRLVEPSMVVCIQRHKWRPAQT